MNKFLRGETEHFKEMLRAVLDASGPERTAMVKAFQKTVWNNEEGDPDKRQRRILDQLAYDLDFYEPDIDRRREDPSFFGAEKLEAIVREALESLA